MEVKDNDFSYKNVFENKSMFFLTAHQGSEPGPYGPEESNRIHKKNYVIEAFKGLVTLP